MKHPNLEPAILFARGRGYYWHEANALECPVIDLGLAHGHGIRRARRISRAIRHFDVHHFHSAEPLVMLGSVLCPGTTRVYTHRGGLIRYSTAKRIRYELTGVLLRRYFHGFSGNTRHGARSGAVLYRMRPDRFDVTYNGIAFELLTPRRPADAVRAELGLASSKFVLGTAANLKAWKRIDRLVDLVARVNDPRLRLVVVGDGPERNRLEAKAADLAVAGRVIFVGAHPHPADYLQLMDAFCLPSMALESFGNAAVEAMAMGIPTVVFSDGGGMTEHIDDGRNGFVVPDDAVLADTIHRLMGNPLLRREIGERAKNDVRTRYTTARAAAAYSRLYDKAVAATGTRARADWKKPG